MTLNIVCRSSIRHRDPEYRLSIIYSLTHDLDELPPGLIEKSSIQGLDLPWADPGGGAGGLDPPFVPRCRLFNIGPKIGPPSGPPFLL